ncbi:MAG: LacI family transcriptional regulator [Melioribacteraceae bacterium]|nr:LacI family transcriptional regulator [Melioribacteraceae bacterium]
MNQITIKDLASNLGLSASTISRALNDHPDINVETKKLVNDLAEKLDYEPNFMARNLKSKNSNQIGIIVPEIKHDFFSKAISGIEEVAYKNGFTVIVSQSNEDEEREKLNANSLYQNRISGMIVSLSQTTKNIDHFRNLLKKGVKIVFFDRVTDDIDTYKVVIDDYQSSYDAVSYLISKGYKKIVHLAGPQNLTNCLNRYRGYKNAITDANLIFREEFVFYGGMHEDDGKKDLEKLIDKKIEFDAVFAVNDPVAIGAIVALKKKGLKIPEDVAVLGFSNNPITEYVTPSITTVDQPAYEMGKLSASILISLIRGDNIENDSKLISLPTKLIIREST